MSDIAVRVKQEQSYYDVNLPGSLLIIFAVTDRRGKWHVFTGRPHKVCEATSGFQLERSHSLCGLLVMCLV